MKLSFLDKIILPLNLIFLFLQLRDFNLLPGFLNFYIIDLFFPYIIISNILFFLYWIIRYKWPFILFIPFTVFYNNWALIYNFPNNVIRNSNNSSKIMSYNVRLFNKYSWINNTDVPERILRFIDTKKPDLICFQEYSVKDAPDFIQYPYKFIHKTKFGGNSGLAIFSKYKIVNQGSISFQDSNNGAIFSDVLIKNDTIRIYNIHLESLRMNLSEKNKLSIDESNNIPLKLNRVFDKQIEQIKLFQAFDKKNFYPTIICTDLNNSQFSEVYNKIRGQKIDCFKSKGEGLGATFSYKLFPFRIDYIFLDQKFKIYQFETFSKVDYSDHKPIMAEFEL
tara:strand:- start:1185 stop:2192 length:1008 start_codon:yes stop_codon:yes gene_type:complete